MAAEARLLSRYHWQTDNPEFGGFSALEVGEDGLALTVLMDRGRLVQGQLLRTSTGIEGINVTVETNLLGLDGKPLSGEDDDSEGLALDGQGGFYVSFEGPARVRFGDANVGAAVSTDQALYAAKDAGRNCVRTVPPKARERGASHRIATR